MKKIIKSLFVDYLFWFLFFAFLRGIFLVYYIPMLAEEKIPFFQVFPVFWHALKLDFSAACYIMAFPFLLLALQSIVNANWIYVIRKIYTALIIFIYSIITSAELGIYGEWKTKLHYKALQYLSHPKEVFDSTSTKSFILLTVFIFGIFFFSFWIYRRYFIKQISIKRNLFYSFLFFIITPFFIVFGVRGGFQGIPINQSDPYYSKHDILNLAAVNSGWNFFISVLENNKFMHENPYKSFDDKEALQRISHISYVSKDTTQSILKISKPNIVLFIIESWSADLIESLGGDPDITPEFRKLEKEGILFTNLYVSGNRSQEAMAAIFGGFPSIPITSITHDAEKFKKLPSLVQNLRNVGYTTSFYFGGQLIYGNLKAYILYNGFDRIIEDEDFPRNTPQGKLSIYDEIVFRKQLEDLNKEGQPFFSVVFTASTHSPYDVPLKKRLPWNKTEEGYVNSAYYTDQCFGEYFAEAKKQAWYNNTLFILVADHSHNSYKNWSVVSPEYRKIPMLLFGPVIKDEYKGTQYKKIASQTDIPVTLLKQLGLPAKDFMWSKNLFNPYSPEYAFYSFDQGLGWITPEGYFAYDKLNNYYFREEIRSSSDSIKTDGKAYLQVLFKQFMDY